MTWTQGSWRILGVGLLAVLAMRAPADVVENPYRVFVDRNPFNLKPAPVQTNTAAPVKEVPKVEIKLTGIAAYGKRKAFFQLTEMGKQTTNIFVTLGEDEKRDDLEVLRIDERKKSVRIRKDGAEMELTFASHGIQAPTNALAMAVTPGAPGGAPVVPGSAPLPGAAGGAVPALSANAAANISTANSGGAGGAVSVTPAGVRTVPSRQMRVQPGGGTMDPNMAARYGLPQQNQNLPVVRAPETPAHNLSAEEQVILLELQKATVPQVGFPPTPGLPGMGGPGAPGVPGTPPPLPGVPR